MAYLAIRDHSETGERCIVGRYESIELAQQAVSQLLYFVHEPEWMYEDSWVDYDGEEYGWFYLITDLDYMFSVSEEHENNTDLPQCAIFTEHRDLRRAVEKREAEIEELHSRIRITIDGLQTLVSQESKSNEETN